jgi:hypothetical protein
MKQYTTPEQTAKLIELGFEKPKSIEEFLEPENDWSIGGLKQRKAYSIGELIEMLETLSVSISVHNLKWSVDTYHYGIDKYELIDALFAIVIKCKENGEI